MAETTKQRAGELLRGVFKILMENPDGLPARKVLKELEKEVPPTAFELAAYPSRPETRRYEFIVRFSTISSVKAGWLVKDKGLWSLTEDGRKAHKSFTTPERFIREADLLYKVWAEAQAKPDPLGNPEEESTPEEESFAAATLEDAEERAWAEVESHLAVMNPYDFQDLVAGLLRGMGYHVAWISPPGPDRGIDIIAHMDPLGITGPRIKVQVKRHSGEKTGVEGIRSFMATLADGDVGLFVSSGGFTKDAADEARRQERRRLTLVDLQRLFDLWVEHYAAIPEAQRRLLPLRAVHFLATNQ